MNIEHLTNYGYKMTASKNTIIFKGEIAHINPYEVIKPFFNEVKKGVLEENLTDIETDFTDLLFVNSSGYKEIVSGIIDLIRSAPQIKAVRIKLNKSNFSTYNSLSRISLMSKKIIVDSVNRI